MGIFKKIRNKKDIVTEDKTVSVEQSNVESYDFNVIRNIIEGNTLDFDIGKVYFDSDGLSSQFFSKELEDMEKEIKVNFRKEKADLYGEAKQVVVHFEDKCKRKDKRAHVYIIFSDSGIEIGSDLFELSDLAKSKGHKDFTTLATVEVASDFEGLSKPMSHDFTNPETDEYGKRFKYTFNQSEKIEFDNIPEYLGKLDSDFVTLWNNMSKENGFTLSSNVIRR